MISNKTDIETDILKRFKNYCGKYLLSMMIQRRFRFVVKSATKSSLIFPTIFDINFLL